LVVNERGAALFDRLVRRTFTAADISTPARRSVWVDGSGPIGCARTTGTYWW
jgi:hypothetical protein